MEINRERERERGERVNQLVNDITGGQLGRTWLASVYSGNVLLYVGVTEVRVRHHSTR